jgi:phosphate transport system permease protein
VTRQQTNRLVIIFISLVALVVILPIVLVIGFVIYQGIGTLSWEFLTAMPRNGMREGGIMPALLGTVFLTFGTAIAAFPLAIAAAIYLAEYARENRLTRWGLLTWLASPRLSMAYLGWAPLSSSWALAPRSSPAR